MAEPGLRSRRGPRGRVSIAYAIDARCALAELTAAGGKTMSEAMEMPGMGCFGYFTDPSGAHMGFQARRKKETTMKLNPHLNFNGSCIEACRYYQQYLGAKQQFSLTYGASPMAKEFPSEFADKIMHATIQIGDTLVMVSDSPPQLYQQPNGFCIALSFDDPAKAESIFQALAENGKVNMPLQETFWAKRFGMVIDQFGIPWMVNCGDPEYAG
jgi:PhnB protein